MSTDPDKLFDEILQRLTALETISSATVRELKVHMQAEPEQLDKIRQSIDRAHAQTHAQILKIAEELGELRVARSKEKGFWAGAAFTFTAVGTFVAAMWNKLLD